MGDKATQASISQMAKVRARFTPQRTDDLKAGGHALIGREGVFQALWIVEDGYEYAGQWAMGIPRDWCELCDFAWVPLCDLTVLEVLDEGLSAYFSDQAVALSDEQNIALCCVMCQTNGCTHLEWMRQNVGPGGARLNIYTQIGTSLSRVPAEHPRGKGFYLGCPFIGMNAFYTPEEQERLIADVEAGR